jgi:class 3 adenylate cyclase
MEAPPLERKLVAILAADVAGYSRLMGTDEEGTLATLSAFRTVTDALIAQHSGRICGTAGDSVLAEFASVFAAVQCAVEIQTALARANQDLPEQRRMWFRIGVNVGDVMVKDGDIFGDGVNIATRIEGLADPGGVCISRGVHDHVMRRVSYRFEDLGEKSVKNIAQPIRVFRLIFDRAEMETLETPLPEEAFVGSDALVLDEIPVGAVDRFRACGLAAGRTHVLGFRKGQHAPSGLRGLSNSVPRRQLCLPRAYAPRRVRIERRRRANSPGSRSRVAVLGVRPQQRQSFLASGLHTKIPGRRFQNAR